LQDSRAADHLKREEKEARRDMANKRRTTSSATGKRQQQGRESQQNRAKSVQNQNARRNRRKRVAPRRSSWLFVGGALVVIAAVVGLFIFLSNQSSSSQSGSTTSSPAGTPADTTTLKEVTNVDPTLLGQVGTGGIANPFQQVSGSPSLLTGPTGKPEVFFYGAEWCPLCAAERWSIVVALSRFGTFHNLNETMSSSTDSYPNTSTFTFYNSSYSSSYIDFAPIENADRQQNTLQTPTATEQQILSRYNVSGYPFMDIGDRYLITQASYNPAILRTNPQDPGSQPLTQQEIASQLGSENTVSKNILGAANYLTAAICSITKNQPSTVCDSSIQQIEAALSKQAGQSNTTSFSSRQMAIATLSASDIWYRKGEL
jgi:thiol-disulfide isomerase/thioredoxin